MPHPTPAAQPSHPAVSPAPPPARWTLEADQEIRSRALTAATDIAFASISTCTNVPEVLDWAEQLVAWIRDGTRP